MTLSVQYEESSRTAHDDTKQDTDDEVPDGHAHHDARDSDVFGPMSS